MTLDPDSFRNNKTFTALLRRETIILIVLAAATVPLFLFTRSMAAWNRQTNIAAGRVWYERARKSVEEGGSETALDYLRKAATADRDNMDYSLALAEALDAADQSDEARQILVRLRDLRPEDGRINLDLASLVLSSDPLANGIGARERAQRLTLALGIAANRLEACSTQGAIPDPTAAEMLKIELAHTRQQVSGNSAGTELNLLRDGLKIASRAVRTAKDNCKPASDAEQAVVLSAERHKVNAP